MLTTNLPETVRRSSSEEAVSVIHAPESFMSWVRSLSLTLYHCELALKSYLDVNGPYDPIKPAKCTTVSPSRRKHLFCC